MALTIDRDAIRERNERLERAGAELKAFFVGIDGIIDDLVNAVRIWYLMPEVLSRPVIVNLWGMTGVGKTDMIRRFVKALDYQDRFCEVELSNGDTTSWWTSVGQVLDGNQMNDPNPKIILFDEIQRFNTLDMEGKPLESTKFTDFWELLSDGRLAKRQRDDLDYYLNDMNYTMRDQRKRKEKGEEIDLDAGIGWWEAQSLKRMLGMAEDTADVAEMSRSQMIARIQQAKMSKRVYEPVDHSKSLILISGNLDEAFSMARMADEADIDADIFHAFTQKITVVDVKGALTKRFKPEQVARFGNIHLIYTSLKRADFEELIEREIDRVTTQAREHFGVRVTVSAAVRRLVYRNGVFPVQGVRPVFSSIIDIVESNLSRFLFEALMEGHRKIALDYDETGKRLVATFSKGNEVDVPYVGRLDRVRQRNVADVVANVSAHEAGHAVAYAVLFGLAPLQLTSKVASSYAAGFTFHHEIHETRDQMIGKIKVLLAGGIAEDIVFGPGNATSGRASDRVSATELTIDFVRRYGFDREFQANYTLDFGYVMDKTATDSDIEKLITRLAAETHEMLIEHRGFLLDLARDLQAGKLESHDVVAIATRHNVPVMVKTEGYLHLPDYRGMLEAPR